MLHVSRTENLGDYTLLCSFDNGEIREVDLTPILKFPAFQDLQDVSKFQEFGVLNTIFRSNGADIAPELLLQHSKAV